MTEKIERFRALAEKDPKNPLHRFALAGAYLAAGDHAAAEASYARCLELDPRWMMAAVRRGRCLIALRRWDEARAALDLGAALAAELGHDEPLEEIAALRDELPA